MRLFKRGDEIADAVRQKKLQREYKRLAELAQFIYWSSVGREGAYHFEAQLKQKEMAESLSESVAAGFSVSKTQKMITQAIEAQRKSNAARTSYSGSSASTSRYHANTRYRDSGRGRGRGRGRVRGRGRGRSRGRGRGRGRARGGRSSASLQVP